MNITIPASRDLREISEANPGWKIERETDGSIRMSPTGTRSGIRNSVLTAMMSRWAERVGGVVADSSTGFVMPDTALLAPDASWISAERWKTADDSEDYLQIVPDVCVELRSRTDRVDDLVAKLKRYRAYGAQYVLLVDPYERTTWSDGEPPAGFPVDFTSVFDAA